MRQNVVKAVRQDAEGRDIHAYRVEFTWRESYNNYDLGVHCITLAVEAATQFEALQIAWDRLSPLGLPEPAKFNAGRRNACD
jgi:hypothetical protein